MLEISFELRALFNAWIIQHSNLNNDQTNGPFLNLLNYAKSKMVKI